MAVRKLARTAAVCGNYKAAFISCKYSVIQLGWIQSGVCKLVMFGCESSPISHNVCYISQSVSPQCKKGLRRSYIRIRPSKDPSEAIKDPEGPIRTQKDSGRPPVRPSNQRQTGQAAFAATSIPWADPS